MANWERKEADTLAEAISKHCRSNPAQVQGNALLAVVQIAVDAAANTVSTSSGDLRRCRAQVCSICRDARLYACDVTHGWSDNCAMVGVNTTEFGGL